MLPSASPIRSAALLRFRGSMLMLQGTLVVYMRAGAAAGLEISSIARRLFQHDRPMSLVLQNCWKRALIGWIAFSAVWIAVRRVVTGKPTIDRDQ